MKSTSDISEGPGWRQGTVLVMFYRNGLLTEIKNKQGFLSFISTLSFVRVVHHPAKVKIRCLNPICSDLLGNPRRHIDYQSSRRVCRILLMSVQKRKGNSGLQKYYMYPRLPGKCGG